MKQLIFLSLVAASAWAEQPLATYPKAAHTRIGNDLVIGGELYRLAYFVTSDSMKKVARFFVKRWDEQGYPVTANGDFVSEGTVSAFFTREGLVRSVVLVRHEGKTLGFTVLKDLWVRPAHASPDRLPALEGALFSSELVVRADSGGSQHRTALIARALQPVRDDLEAAARRVGYRATRETGVEQGGRVLELNRGREQLVISLVPIDARTTGVDETWVGGSP